MSEETDPHSKALDVELIADPIARAEAEDRNGIRQFDVVVELIDYFLSPDRKLNCDRPTCCTCTASRLMESVLRGRLHPFTDGNGRTARALSYLLPCARLGYRLPGKNTIPEQIAADKTPYYKALEAADREWAGKKIDLSVLEKLLADLPANQLVSVHDEATGEKQR